MIGLFALLACHDTSRDSGAGAADTSQPDSAGDTSATDEDDARVRALTDLPEGDRPCASPVLGRVVHVVDGDTAWVQPDDGSSERDVRFIGVDTPEIAHEDPAECYGDEAAAFTLQELDGRMVWLTFDEECLDPYDRTLAYAFRDTTDEGFFNRRLARAGYAYQLSIAPNESFKAEIRDDVAAAKADKLGLWGACRQ